MFPNAFSKTFVIAELVDRNVLIVFAELLKDDRCLPKCVRVLPFSLHSFDAPYNTTYLANSQTAPYHRFFCCVAICWRCAVCFCCS